MNWLPPTASTETKLPPRPGIKKRCPACGQLHYSRDEVLSCAEKELGAPQKLQR